MKAQPALRRSRGFAASVVLALAFAVVLAACGSSAKQAKTLPGANRSASIGWPTVGGAYGNTRYSPLTQVNTSNVTKLGIAWSLAEGHELEGWEDYPVVVGGTMYITTSADEVEALDATSSAVRWTYTPKVDFFKALAGGGGGSPQNRGVAVANGKVYVTTFDDKLIALDQANGRPVFQSQISDPNLGYSETAAPTVYGNTAYVGGAIGEGGDRGFVAAYDATSGRQLWRFYTVPAPGHGWVPAQGHHGGGDVWMWQTIDPATNTLYAGTGNPSPDFIASVRGGCDPHTNSLIALNASTGALRWAHSDICPDAWDYDSAHSPLYFDLAVGGRTVHAVGHANKSGFFEVLDARTGRLISKSPHITPYTEPHPLPTAAGVNVCPGFQGGIEYSPASFDAQTGAIYQDALNICDKYVADTAQQASVHNPGQEDLGGVAIPLKTVPFTGYLASIDAATGKVNWEDRLPKPSVGGTLTTAGGLVFTPDDNGDVYAADARTGRILWNANLGLPFGAAPMTYEVAGTQYVAIAAGGSAAAAIENVPRGGELVVFKLGGSPVHTFPAANPLSNPALRALPDLSQYARVAPYLYVDAAQKKAVIQVVAAATPSDGGFNFDGYDKGRANFVIPVGWSATLEFSNKSATPHDVALTQSLKVPLTAVPPAGEPKPVAIPGPTTLASGISASSGTLAQPFSTAAPGRYYLVCGVPGHVQAGMWDYLTVSATAKRPAIQVR